jgi:hypothetical protein
METPEIDGLKERVRTLEVQMAENTEMTAEGIKISQQVQKDTASLVEFTKNAQGALNTLNWIMSCLKPIAWLGVGILSIWGFITFIKVLFIQAVTSGHIK